MKPEATPRPLRVMKGAIPKEAPQPMETKIANETRTTMVRAKEWSVIDMRMHRAPPAGSDRER